MGRPYRPPRPPLDYRWTCRGPVSSLLPPRRRVWLWLRSEEGRRFMLAIMDFVLVADAADIDGVLEQRIKRTAGEG